MKSLIKQGEDRVARAKSKLNPEQILFAEWLAIPSSQRIPKQQKDFAYQLNINEVTLVTWKRIPEIWEVRDSYITAKGKEAVPEAMETVITLMKSPNARIALQAALGILKDFSEPSKHTHIIDTIKAMYEQYNE